MSLNQSVLASMSLEETAICLNTIALTNQTMFDETVHTIPNISAIVESCKSLTSEEFKAKFSTYTETL